MPRFGVPARPRLRAVRELPVDDQRRGDHGTGCGSVQPTIRQPCGPLPRQSASEDFSDISSALGTPYTYWGIGGVDPDTFRAAERAGRVDQDIPVKHSAAFAPVIQPTLETGTDALVTAALAWL